MAITKILNINCSTEGNPASHLKNALEYVQNPDKTEKCHLVGSVNCLPDSAYEQMLDTKRVYGKSGKRQGYHVIISFPPDEAVTPEQARFVAEGFMEDVLKDEYEAVYGIHTDKEHTHIHIIWNSVNLVTGEKYNSPKGNWKNHLQPITNKYCEMLGLDIMPAEYAKNPVNMSKEKWEYEQSFKDYILNDAKLCLSYAGSLEHFIFLMKRMGYEFKGKDYLSVRIPGMKLYHRLDKLNDIFSKEELLVILKYGYGHYYRKYQTKGILYVKRANLTPMQKKYYAKMYRLGLIEKKCYQCHSAEMAKEIKRMQFLQEQYLFICKNDVSSIADLIQLNIKAKQTLADAGIRQKEIYRERSIRKRKCKTTEDFMAYQIWYMDSSNKLDGLKAEKKKAKSDIRMINACMGENLYTALGYVDEMEKLDYGAEDVLPTMYDYQKRDIAEEFEIVESMDKVVVDTAKTEKDVAGISEDCRVAEMVFADALTDNMIEKLTTERPLYEDFGEKLMQSFHNNHNDDDLGYIEAGNSFELPTDTDKREYNTENYEVFVDTPDVSEKMAEDVAENGRAGIDVGITDDDIIESAELTVEGQAEQIASTIQRYYKSYDYLSAEDKARLFNFKIDDNSYNLELHAKVLKKLGVHMYGSDRFEDYQSIYEETMRKAEKQDSKYEYRYDGKRWERDRGR